MCRPFSASQQIECRQKSERIRHVFPNLTGSSRLDFWSCIHIYLLIFFYLRRSHRTERFAIFSGAAAERGSTRCSDSTLLWKVGSFCFPSRGFRVVFGDSLDLEVPSSQRKVSPSVFSHSFSPPGMTKTHFVQRTHFQKNGFGLAVKFQSVLSPFHR